MTVNATILAIRNNCDIADYVRTWANCHDVGISDAGEIWIANPQTGHWLDDDAKAAFVAWFAEQERA